MDLGSISKCLVGPVVCIIIIVCLLIMMIGALIPGIGWIVDVFIGAIMLATVVISGIGGMLFGKK